MDKWILKLAICIIWLLFVASITIAAEKSFIPQQDYKGAMFVVINPGSWGCDSRSSAKIIWGPWQTKEVKLSQLKAVAIKFEKKKRDSVPLTVIVSGCEGVRIDLGYGEPEPGKYLIVKPAWEKR